MKSEVYAVAFGLSAWMFVILFVVPFATNFGKTEEKAGLKNVLQ